MNTPVATPVQDTPSGNQKLSRTEQLLQDIRKSSLCQQLIPMEAANGWPIPLRKEGKVYITVPFFGLSPRKGESLLFPLFATITVNWDNGTPVEYVNLQFRKPSPDLNWEGQQVGTFPHAAVAQITVSEYRAKRGQLLAMYDEMLQMLGSGSTFLPEWCDRFGELLQILMEPSLEPYYRALAPKFFERFLSIAK